MARGRRVAASGAGAEPSVLSTLDPNANDASLDPDASLDIGEDDDASDESYSALPARKKKGTAATAAATKKKKKKKLSLAEDSDDDEDGGYLAPLVDSDDGKDGGEDDDEDDDARKSISLDEAMGVVPKTSASSSNSNGDKSKSKKAGKKRQQRRRRRSSARFLRLSGRFGPDDGDDADVDADIMGGGAGGAGGDKENLGEVYRQAIRMNAENKINAGNSWGLRLIENMDKFTYHDEEEGEDGGGNVNGNDGAAAEGSNAKRVNFTRASCTLDASVKIYGYRVDDVHLTSYRVLHNLNRTDTAGGGKKSAAADGGNADGGEAGDDLSDDDGEGGGARSTRKGGRRGTTDTLESNLANINMSKLESAPDIDPLFRKMSKAFDEGGARGLLLNNLGVAQDGCRIEFDSKDDAVAEDVDDDGSGGGGGEESRLVSDNAFSLSSKKEGGVIATHGGGDGDGENENDGEAKTSEENAEGDGADGKNGLAAIGRREEGDVDITGLVRKLREVLNGSTLESLPLVPQLETLRADYAALEAEGFSDKKVPASKPKRYGVTEEEEKEAEKSIHLEAMERSHRSMANTSFAPSIGGVDDGDTYGADDFGGGDDDFSDGGGDDVAFNDFLAMDENAGRYSTIEFRSSGASDVPLPGTALRTRANTNVLLDAICSSDALVGGGEFEYFSAEALDKITKGNSWAGSEHWKKTDKLRRKKSSKQDATKKQSKKKKASKGRTFIDMSATCHACLDELLKNMPMKGKSDPLQLTKAAKQKQKKTDNLLPPDAGVGIEQLSRLFMRPDATLKPKKNDLKNARKSVGFLDEGGYPTVAFDDGVDESFCDDDDGPGFQLADDSGDFVVADLEGVRRVDKVDIGHATVAKKVDVRKLKKDLWGSLEMKTIAPQTISTETASNDTNGEDELAAPRQEPKPTLENTVSFKETVEELASSQSQTEVTLPFYFICLLHLANEKGLRLDPAGNGLSDFVISRDDGSPTFGIVPEAGSSKATTRGIKNQTYQESDDDEMSDELSDSEYD